MSGIVAEGLLLILRELGLDLIKHLLTHDRRHLGNCDPLCWIGSRMPSTHTTNRSQRRVPLMGLCRTGASNRDRPGVDGMRDNPMHSRLIPPLATARSRHSPLHELFGDPHQTLLFLCVGREDLGHDGCFVGFQTRT